VVMFIAGVNSLDELQPVQMIHGRGLISLRTRRWS